MAEMRHEETRKSCRVAVRWHLCMVVAKRRANSKYSCTYNTGTRPLHGLPRIILKCDEENGHLDASIQFCTGRVVSGCVLHCSLASCCRLGPGVTCHTLRSIYGATETPQLRFLLFFFFFFFFSFLGMPLVGAEGRAACER